MNSLIWRNSLRPGIGVFRGVEVEGYELIPKVGRRGTRKHLDGTDLEYSADAERKCIERFKREVRPHLMQIAREKIKDFLQQHD